MELHEITTEMEASLTALDNCVKSLNNWNIKAVNTRADYEGKKNQFLLSLQATETKLPTVAMMTAMYRDKFSNERLQWQLALAQAESAKDAHRAIMAKLNVLQSLLRLKEGEMQMSNLQDARM